MDKAPVTKEQIQEAILSSSGGDRALLLNWLLQMDKMTWDLETQQDFCEGGMGKSLLDRVKKDFRVGRCPKRE